MSYGTKHLVEPSATMTAEPESNPDTELATETATETSPTAPSQSQSANAVAIDLQNLNSWYNNRDFQALHNICLRFVKNQVSALIGPSGCGKSTLLRWINRMNDVVTGASVSGTLRMGDLDILASDNRCC